MKRPDFRKTPIALALSGLLFTGVNVQADSPNDWGRWSRGGGHQGGHGDGHGWGDIEQDNATSEIIEQLLEQLAQEGEGGLTDPPPGHWAFYGAEGSWTCCNPPGYLGGNTATGTLVLTTGEPVVNGDSLRGAPTLVGGTIALNAVDSNGDPVIMSFPPDYAQVGSSDGYGGIADPFLPFSGEGPDGWIYGQGSKSDDITTGEFYESGGEVVRILNGGPGDGFGYGIFVAGQPTPLADMAVLAGFVEPVVGLYSGGSYQLGYDVALGVDFTAGTWGGSFYGGEGDGFDFNASGDFVGTAAVSDRLSAPDPYITAIDGSVKFSFMGQDAQDIGGNFDVTAEFSGGSYYERVTDVFAASGEELVPRGDLPGPIDVIVHEPPIPD